MNSDSEQLRRTAKRLERYAIRSREKIWKGDYIAALADFAATGEIARRLYKNIRAALQDDPASANKQSPGVPT